MTLEERYLNLAMINLGEAITRFSELRIRGAKPGEFNVVKQSLDKAKAALDGTSWEPQIDPQHQKQRSADAIENQTALGAGTDAPPLG